MKLKDEGPLSKKRPTGARLSIEAFQVEVSGTPEKVE